MSAIVPPPPIDPELVARLGTLELFAGLAPDALGALASVATLRELAADATLVRQGAEGGATFVLLAGRLVAVFTDSSGDEHTLSEMAAGAIVGEIPSLAGGTRTATVRATEPSTVAVVDADAFARILEASPDLAARVSEGASRRLRQVQLVSHLTRLFPDIEAAALQALGRVVEWVSLPAGEVLFRQDEAGDCAYLVVSGRVRVALADAGGGERVIGEISSGELVGEQAILLDTPRSATVYAGRDTDLARIPRDVFNELVQRHPAAMLRMFRTLVERTQTARHASRRRIAQPLALTLIALDPGLSQAQFAAPLLAELEKLGRTIELTPDDVDARLAKPGIAESDPGDPAYIRLRQWLHDTEESHRFLVYRTGERHPRWSERAIRQSDHVVFVADASRDPELRSVERAFRSLRTGRAPRASLVLWHRRDVERPTGTKRWLEARDVEAVYHVRDGDGGSFARLARLLAGCPLGVVFGGGGARGFAHLGVLRALGELGVPVDVIGGASIGAAVTGLTAQGRTIEQATAIVTRSFRSLLDYTLPIAALLSGRRISAAIEGNYGEWDIEDLWLPYYCVSTNLTTARVVVHRRGDLTRAVRASVAIPGVLPPVVEGQDLLVDGGVLNNLPLDVMREINPTGPVIAVHVVPRHGPRAKADFGLSVSGWRLALGRLIPWRRPVPVPDVVTTILRAVFVSGEPEVARMIEDGLPDLHLSINASGIGLLAFGTVPAVEKIGYEAALEPLRQWLTEAGLVPAKTNQVLPS